MIPTRARVRTTLLAVLLIGTGAMGACTNGPLLEGGCVVGPCGPPNIGDISGILPNPASLAVGDSLLFFVYTASPLVWSVADGLVGTVTSKGLFRARAVGSTTVIAVDTSLAGLRRTATVTVHAR